jgi:hypothetical protein
MAATPKQLAALKKGREAMAKKRAAGTVKKRVAKKPAVKRKAKVAVKKNPVKRRAAAPKFSVKIVTKDGRAGYLLSDYSVDTEKSAAWKTTLKSAENIAKIFFTNFKSQLRSVEVIPAPKS